MLYIYEMFSCVLKCFFLAPVTVPEVPVPEVAVPEVAYYLYRRG